uniref:Uncharacterized protein n=1 Tax=Anopheles atroparvus TaxID=41427 RepID=A0AAG5CQE1_ANOAO
MSSLRKSASFRSRIPVRRSRLPHRRCTSPDQPSVATVNSHGSESSIATGHNGGDGGQVRAGQQPRAWYDRSHCYSSSSYSSSDESYDSEAAPFQHLLNQSSAAAKGGLMLLGSNPAATTGAGGDPLLQQGVDFPLALEGQTFLPHQHQHPFAASACLSTSTDAMSLDGLLDCVSTGTFSCPPSPKSKSYLDTSDRGQLSGIDVSSYESLEKFSYALETLKISDSVHAQRNFPVSATDAPSVPSAEFLESAKPSHTNLVEQQRPGFKGDKVLPMASEVPGPLEEEDDDLIKQRKLSDWYYIKTAPTKKPSSPFERRRAIGGRVQQQQQNDAVRRTTTRFSPSPAPRASNPDVSGRGSVLEEDRTQSEQRNSERYGVSGQKFSSPIPRPRRLPMGVGLEHSWDQDASRSRQVAHAVTKSASSSSVNVGARGQLAMGTRGPTAARQLHSNTDLQQAGTRKAIAPDDSLGLTLEDNSSAILCGLFGPGQDQSLSEFSRRVDERFSPYCRRRNPPQRVPQWFPPPPPPPYHYPHHHHPHPHAH